MKGKKRKKERNRGEGWGGEGKDWWEQDSRGERGRETRGEQDTR